jgi:phenylacetaldehyde dehydrogenase
VTRRLDIGIVWINDHHRIDPASPWGGFKDSGIGSENGVDAFRAYTRQQSVVINASNAQFDWFASVEDLRYS